jgi:hypothetical protein
MEFEPKVGQPYQKKLPGGVDNCWVWISNLPGDLTDFELKDFFAERGFEIPLANISLKIFVPGKCTGALVAVPKQILLDVMNSQLCPDKLRGHGVVVELPHGKRDS